MQRGREGGRSGGTISALVGVRFHNLARTALMLFNRNPRVVLLHQRDPSLYAQDGLWTYHAHCFLNDPQFQRAYQRGIQAASWDYGWPWRVHVGLWVASVCARLDGAFVECGTGRGFMASAICEFLGWSEREFFLFDTFQPNKVDESGIQHDDAPKLPIYADGPQAVAANFVEWPGVRLVVGKVPDTLNFPGTPHKVACVHVDMNHPDAEVAAIHHFWPRLTLGGMLLLDDYGYAGFDESRKAADHAAQQLGFHILSLPTGQGLAIKQSACTS